MIHQKAPRSVRGPVRTISTPGGYLVASDGEEVTHVTTSNDSLVFEDRSELGAVLQALEDWLKAHPVDRKREDVAQAVRLLDRMEMNW